MSRAQERCQIGAAACPSRRAPTAATAWMLPGEGLAREEAEEKTRACMRGLPAWRGPPGLA